MKIRASDWYFEHQGDIWNKITKRFYHTGCQLDDCERFYCSGKTHRRLYRLCETNKDRAVDGEWYTGDCPSCSKEYEDQKFLEYKQAERERMAK